MEHHDYWLRTCNAGFSDPQRFYDIEQSIELLKIDWKQLPSLKESEREAAYRQSKSWRQTLFRLDGQGFHRVKVADNHTDVRILRKGPVYKETNLSLKTGSDLLTQEYWVYPTRMPVIAYHAIADAPEDRYAVSPIQFKLQLEELIQHFEFVTAAQAFTIWKKQRGFPKNLAILTFDDGYQDFLSIIPLLEEFNIKATVFIPTRWVGKENTWDRGAFTKRRHLDWQELREIVSMGHEVGSHTAEHYRLTMLSTREVSREIIESKNTLVSQLNQPVYSIAYPFGSVNNEIIKIVQTHYNVGFVAGQQGVLDWHEGPYAIRRIYVKAQEDPSSLLIRIANYMTQAPKSEPVWYPSRKNHKRRDEG
jgi:peptidoglycan/xylan/chitin deacetylase (PgdA/CDA1 family)